MFGLPNCYAECYFCADHATRETALWDITPVMSASGKLRTTVTFVAVSLDDRTTRPKIPDFMKEFQIGFRVWTGGSTMDLDDLKLGQALPATAFLDREGRIVARVLGEVRKEEVTERLEWLLGDQKSPAPDPLVRHTSGN